MPIITYPLAAAALVALPLLTTIYFMRRKFRRYPVSSLLLWDDPRRFHQGGTRIERLRLPPIFFLELLILLTLTAAAMDLRRYLLKIDRPLTLIVDDSASLTAQPSGNKPIRDQAIRRIQKRIKDEHITSVRLILAGVQPHLIKEAALPNKISGLLKNAWTAEESTANLPAALELARKLGRPNERLCILSDHPPPSGKVPGAQVLWIAVGRPLSNIGIVQAVRSDTPDHSQCLVECLNAANHPATIQLSLISDQKKLKTMVLHLEPGTRIRQTFTLSPQNGDLAIQLNPHDALRADNQVLLPPEHPKKVRVRLAMGETELRRQVEQALASSGLRAVRDLPADLIITDQPTAGTPAVDTWIMRLLRPKKPRPCVGPFVANLRHPLVEGLQFSGVIWGAGTHMPITGTPVIMAGNEPLLIDRPHPDDTREFVLYLDLKTGNLHQTPCWPILFYNLLALRSSLLPGCRSHQTRAGEAVSFTPETGARALTWIRPDGTRKTIQIHADNQPVLLSLHQAGIHILRTPQTIERVACNLLTAEETNLTGCRSGEWGQWNTNETLRRQTASLTSIFGLITLFLLPLHAILLRRGGG